MSSGATSVPAAIASGGGGTTVGSLPPGSIAPTGAGLGADASGGSRSSILPALASFISRARKLRDVYEVHRHADARGVHDLHGHVRFAGDVDDVHEVLDAAREGH